MAKTRLQINAWFEVMAELRPHLSRRAFASRVQRQQKRCGYKVAFLRVNGEVASVAGFRITECLAWGKFLYVDDLVTNSSLRSKGYGAKLLRWLVQFAKTHGCDEFHLDSGIQRLAAHKFYKRHKLPISCYHFSRKLK